MPENEYLDYMKFCLKEILSCMQKISKEAIDRGLDVDENFNKFIDDLMADD